MTKNHRYYYIDYYIGYYYLVVAAVAVGCHFADFPVVVLQTLFSYQVLLVMIFPRKFRSDFDVLQQLSLHRLPLFLIKDSVIHPLC